MTADSLSPDLLEVQLADLVNLPPAVRALHERLALQGVVLGRLEQVFSNMAAKRTREKCVRQ